ncbi:dTDP-4-dehydrorhamnose reductase [Mycobacterium intracellulare]|uniref:dTDP-4-dehydrorhamnose reductase n=1 Tax=Mycobacterium intracellulare TaxID=1767 RepID=UPI0005B3EBDE|nr:dTDP-4-dehydrorhamnose reductase [Mycobacterium intracellulare]AOS93454.1 dTDP-4-dehydrorhamnose reductase [Mycobacterium intracellulare subsp. chimaera]ARV83872.1 NAD(P)-dependent oxidoreductase [Mycobacterium intracellulare subsp. chimaera]ASL11155.1 rmlD [Mycobacterium intracellulare subsp. chimaera]ASL23078.1 rmlD [Mycobacterium intracellulare subsp. chimaera]KPN52998.1 dTDP-4-dehydrorhamnose reductase [Mycobacterium intracellulare subsp. chimaera]
MSGRIVIAGAGGQLGGYLSSLAADQGREVLAHSSSQWDITDPAAAERIVQRGDVVINCAAYTDVDGAETDEAGAFAVNEAGPGHIARACARAGAQLIHVSTDYVFGGNFEGDFGGAAPRPYEPSDQTAPQGVYARSKAAGEQAVLAALPEAVVVRTAWVYTGGAGKDFVAVMRRLAAGDGPVDVVDDQIGSPTYVGDLAAALLQIVDDRVPGPILHAANEGAVSRFEQARAVFEECGADPARVRPVGTDRFPRPAPRPAYSALSGGQSAAAGLRPLRPWRPALVAALAAADRPLPSTRD